MDGVLAKNVAFGLDEVADADVTLIDGELATERVGQETSGGKAEAKGSGGELEQTQEALEHRDERICGRGSQ